MTRHEIESRLESIAESLFYIDMIDRWTDEDRTLRDRLIADRTVLRRQLAECAE